MALAAEDFDALIESMGLAGTAAANLQGTLDRLAAAERETAAVAKVAAETGSTAAQVRAALAEANREAAAAAKVAAKEEEAAAAAAKAASDAAAALVTARAAQAEAAYKAAQAEAALADQMQQAQTLERLKVYDQKLAAEQAADKARQDASLERMKIRDQQMAAEQAAGKQAEETARWFTTIRQNGEQAATSAEALKERIADLTAQYGPAVLVITAYATALLSLGDAAIRFTQEKDALRATFDAFTEGAGGALLDDLEGLAKELPYTADRLNAWAKSMISAVGAGEELRTAVRAVAAATAIMGESGGRAAEGLIKRFAMMAETGQKVKLDRRILSQLAEAGVSVKALAAALGVAPDKLGQMSIAADDLGKAMQRALIDKGSKGLAVVGQSLTSIKAKVTEGWEDAFEDLGDIVGPFMAQLRFLASEFFAGSAGSKALGGVVRGVLTPAFEVATRTVRAAHIAFLQIEIAYLKAAIALRPLTAALDKIGVSGGIVNVAMYLIAGTAIVLATVFGLLAVAVGLVALPFILAGLAIYGVVRAIIAFVGLVQGAVANLDNLKAAAARAGTAFITGLGNAILSGTAWVVGLVTGLAGQIVGAIVGPLQIKSPSRVAERLGGYFTEGLAGGIDDGSEDVEGAATGAGTAAVGGAAGGMRKGKAGKGGGGDRVFAPTFNNCTFGSVGEETFREWMDRWWEEQDAAGGLEPEPA